MSAASPLGGLPQPPLMEDKGGRFTAAWAGWFATAQSILHALSSAGTTASRPAAGLWVGRRYFDTTLGIPVWVQSLNPTVWCNASGAAV